MTADGLAKRRKKTRDFVPPPVSVPCSECNGKGRYHDPSHGASRHCNDCDGTGKVQR